MLILQELSSMQAVRLVVIYLNTMTDMSIGYKQGISAWRALNVWTARRIK